MGWLGGGSGAPMGWVRVAIGFLGGRGPRHPGGDPGVWVQVPALRVPEGDTVYDFAWFPLMDSTQPPTCL